MCPFETVHASGKLPNVLLDILFVGSVLPTEKEDNNISVVASADVT
jgi:hypothetical protein